MNTAASRQVSKDEFYKPIFGKGLDVHPTIVTDKWPYTSEWTFHHITGRPVYGRTVGRADGGTDYFVRESFKAA